MSLSSDPAELGNKYERIFPPARLPTAAFAILLSAATLGAEAGTNKTQVVDGNRLLEAARACAVQVPSLFLSRQEKVETVEAFVLDDTPVRIRAPEGALN